MRVGARGSSLSRVQTMAVVKRLNELNPGEVFEFLAIRTSGDDPSSRPYGPQGVKGLFVKEIESALLGGQIDLAVHSAKDLASELPDGLVLGPAMERAEPWDALVCAQGLGLATLPMGARVGTSSLRRGSFLKAFREDLEIMPLRGNVETRLAKVGRDFEAILLAKAGLVRLAPGHGHAVEDLPPEVMPPSPGQGQLALEFREGDHRVSALLQGLDHEASGLALAAERAFMRRLGLGCTAPVGALCQDGPGGRLVMRAALAAEGRGIILAGGESAYRDLAAAAALGRLVAEKILEGTPR